MALIDSCDTVSRHGLVEGDVALLEEMYHCGGGH